MLDVDVATVIRKHWEVSEPITLTPVPEAMNSKVWFLDTAAGRRVAKAVPEPDQFAGGLRVALVVEQSGLQTGAPQPTRDGRHWVEVDGHAVAVLSYIAEPGLDSSQPQDRARWGHALASLHQTLAAIPTPASADGWPWLVPDPSSPFLDSESWLRPTIHDAVSAAATCWDASHNTLVHGDPSASDFRVDSSGQLVAVIDWGYAMAGPPLTDLACAILFEWLKGRDGEDVINAYDADIAVDHELLQILLRRRLALQAWWLAWREAGGSDLGTQDDGWNRRSLATIKGFIEARGWLRA